ncbi:MAG: STAS domain-containing protein [Acidobacteria bacterium]|nr:STAS domain-containing protein [Acidobacteriota bacterium]MCB9378144.1 STAS domain-containing protein [Holophagales bacterium]
MPFEIATKEEGKVLVVALTGQLDTRASPKLEKSLDEALSGGRGEVLIDCAQLDFITSAGLRVLLMTGKRLASAGGRLALCSLNLSVKEVFDVSGFASLFPIHPNRESSLGWLAENVESARVSHLAEDILSRHEDARRAGRAPGVGADPERAELAAELLTRKKQKKRKR